MEHQEETNKQDTVLSKSQAKKLMKRQRWLEQLPARRKLEREKRKTKRKLRAQEKDTTQQVDKLYTLMADSNNKFKVVIDMDFEDYMTDREICKAVQQVARVYAVNRRSKNPFQLYISSLKGEIRNKIAKICVGYENWDVNCSELDYVALFSDNSTEQTSDINKTSNKNFIYLSGDSDEKLADVDSLIKDESKIFVIGGLVDHNRHKSLCQKRALERGIPTAKLPIGEHLKLNQRHILATVTVFEVLLNVLGSHKQWPEALMEAIPSRKIENISKLKEGKQVENAANDVYEVGLLASTTLVDN